MTRPLEYYENRFTYADYATWPEGERWEIIEGVPYPKEDPFGIEHDEIMVRRGVMRVAGPRTIHARCSTALTFQLHGQLQGRPTEIYMAPFDVLLNEPGDTPGNPSTVVQPDILIVCDPLKLADHGCVGAPDFILEILSPITNRFDRIDKAIAYARHGVCEYWTVDPNARTLQIRIPALVGPSTTCDGWITRNLTAAGIHALSSVPGVSVDFDAAFAALDAPVG